MVKGMRLGCDLPQVSLEIMRMSTAMWHQVTSGFKLQMELRRKIDNLVSYRDGKRTRAKEKAK